MLFGFKYIFAFLFLIVPNSVEKMSLNSSGELSKFVSDSQFKENNSPHLKHNFDKLSLYNKFGLFPSVICIVNLNH